MEIISLDGSRYAIDIIRRMRMRVAMQSKELEYGKDLIQTQALP